MNENPKGNEGTYMWPQGLGIKRSWDAANKWDQFSEDSTPLPAESTKKACASTSTYPQESVIPEASNLGELINLPPISALEFKATPFIEPTLASSTILSSRHLPPLAEAVGYSLQQRAGTLWQPQALTNQCPSNQAHDFGQQWAPRNPEEWHPLNSADNTYITSLASKCGQQGQYFVPEKATTLNPGSYDITTSDDADHIEMGFECVDHWDSGHIQADNQAQSGISSTESPAIPQASTERDLCASDENSKELSYDSCFGVIVFEKFQLQDRFFTGKAAKHVSLEVNGTIVFIKDANSNKYGGLLDQKASRVVVDLIRNHDVELSAYMKTPGRIEVLIYGRLGQSDAIGDMLLERDYFLQRPDSYDASRPYHNPQCLSDSDNEDTSSWECNESSSAQTTALDEEKSKVAELLGSATGPTDFRTAQISDILITRLKKHQTKAVSMMIEKESGNIRDPEFPSIWAENPDTDSSHFKFYNTVTQDRVSRLPKLCLGGLLADEMGLGKTLTTLALIATSLCEKNENPRVPNATLIICPMTTVTCWQDQIEKHFKKASLTYKICHGSVKDDSAVALRSVDVVLTTYETLRAGMPDEGTIMRGKRSRRASLLHDINWHRVVLDEAHIVRNRSTLLFQAVNTLKAKHRWCLTGTPIQNSLEDLGSLVEFLKVDPFDNPSAFRNAFLAPIENGEQLGWERLRSLIAAVALRRTKKDLDTDLNLPPRRETVHWINLNDEEKALYNLAKKYFALAIDSAGSVMNTFQFILRLRQICNHGSDLLPQSLRVWLKEAASLGVTTSPQPQSCEICEGALNSDDESSYYVFSCFHQVCQLCLSTDDMSNTGTGSACPICHTDILEKIKRDVKSTTLHKARSMRYRPSSKVKALLQNLQNNRQVALTSGQSSAKSVVFSAWTSMLDLIGEALSMNGFIWQRLDGSKSLAQRRYTLQDFRMNSNCTVLLASLGSAAVGLDLTMATHVHLMEPGWNPLLEQQAIDRIHRLGQESEVLATRYIIAGPDSIEQYVRRRQEWKMRLISSSLDEPKTRHDEAEAILKDLRHTICTENTHRGI